MLKQCLQSLCAGVVWLLFATCLALAVSDVARAEGPEFTLEYVHAPACFIQWQHPGGVAGFRVERKIAPNTRFGQVKVLGPDVRKFPCSAWHIKQDGQSHVRVIAYQGELDSDPSGVLPFVVLPDPKPVAPTSLSFGAN